MIFRALYPEEFEPWLDHVSHVFPGSRQYFFNHWHNDPWLDLEGVRVAVDDGKIVSTVRVFLRKMYFHGEKVSFGGIGEVSTRTEYRKRGLATQLLKDAIQFMEKRGIAISMLHGNQRIYSDLGWEHVPLYYSKKKLIGARQSDWEVRPVNFQDTDEVKKIATLYDSYSSKFNGTIVRDDMRYWTDWVKTESSDLWVAVLDDEIIGYVSVNLHNRKLHVKELAVSDAYYIQDSGIRFFDRTVSDVIVQMDEENLAVEFPAPIAGGFGSDFYSHGSTMYRVIDPAALPTEFSIKRSDVFSDLMHYQVASIRQDIRSHHVFWRTDGF